MSETESKDGGVSRRDFLRTAGKKAAKEAVTTGTNLLPGGAIVRQFLATPPEGSTTEDDDTTSENVPTPPPVKAGPLTWLASWRAKRDNPSK